MSLEKAIEALTAAVVANTAALGGKAQPILGADPKVIQSAKDAQAKNATDNAAAAAATKPADGKLDYEKDVKAPFLTLVEKVGRDKALAAVNPAPKDIKDKPELWAACVAQIAKAAA